MTVAAMSNARMIFLCALMVTAGPVSMALLTPALPAIADSYGVSEGKVSLVLMFYLCGFAGGQLLAGPLADRCGRRATALGFAAVYLLATGLAFGAQSFAMLLGARALQGLGVASGLVVSRAMVRDSASGAGAVRMLSAIAICNAVVPMLSPALGAVLVAELGWQPIFLAMLAFAVVLMTVLALFQRETLRDEDRSLSLKPRVLLADYSRILRDPAFMLPALMIAAAIGAIYVASVLLPFVLMGQLGLGVTGFGLVMGLQTASFVTGSALCNRLARARGNALHLKIAATLWSFSFGMLIFGPHSAAGYMLPVTGWVCGTAFAIPVLTARAMAGYGRNAGTAAAVLGFTQIGLSALGTSGVALLSVSAGQKLMLVFASCLIVLATCGLMLRRTP